MKVYIGPFVYRWVSYVHERHMDSKYGFRKWEDNKDWKDRSWESLDNALQWLYDKTINRYLDSKERTIRVRIDPYDTWSMDDTLAHIVLPMLKQLKNTKHGSPMVDAGDVPKKLRPPKGQETAWENGDVDDNHHARWDWVLDEMIFAFESKTFDWEDQFTTGEYDLQFQKIEDGEHKGYSEMVKGPNHTAVTDWDGRKEYQKRISNGFRLFGKYFEALWD